jgi:flagellar biosynthesis/type III secretory pathway protein FliH
VPAADGVFVSLAQLLRPPPACAELVPPVTVFATPAPQPLALPEAAELARDVRLFRARLADAFEGACDALLREFAYAVLGRELVLAPPDIAAIAARVIAEHAGAQPLRMRVAPSDVALLAPDANALPPVTSDPELSPGDAILELASGPHDARLGVRLAALLEKLA